MRCGVIGTGALGRGIVASLARAGFPVLVHDRDAGAAAGAQRAPGARRRRRRAQLAAGSDAIFLILPDSPDIFAVVGEIGGDLAAGSVVVIISTVSPETPVELGRQLARARRRRPRLPDQRRARRAPRPASSR